MDVPDELKVQKMCNEAVNSEPLSLFYVPDCFKIEMCEKAVEKDPRSLQFVPHWFVTQQVKPWHIDDLIKWYEGYQKRKAQKAQMKEDLMPIVWHLSRWWASCVPDDEKKRDRIFFFFYHLIC